MAAGAPWHWNAAVWVMEATNDGALHAEPAKQGKGLLIMHVWAARHAGLGQHEHDVSHGMGQEGEVGWQVERGDGTCTLSSRSLRQAQWRRSRLDCDNVATLRARSW